MLRGWIKKKHSLNKKHAISCRPPLLPPPQQPRPPSPSFPLSRPLSPSPSLSLPLPLSPSLPLSPPFSGIAQLHDPSLTHHVYLSPGLSRPASIRVV